MKLNSKYKPILTTDKRIILITGARGSGKSFTAATLAALISYESEHKILFTRYTMNSAKDSVIPEFQSKLRLMNCEEAFSIYSNEVENNGSKSQILFRGIKTAEGIQTGKLKSIEGITTWIYEEAEESKEEEFDILNFSIRTLARQNRIILIFNPPDVEHWIYKKWFEKTNKIVYIDGAPIHMSTHPDVLHIHTTYLDNKQNLSPSFIKSIEDLRETNREKYYRVGLGQWALRNEGVIFKNWIEGDFDTSLPYCYGQDYGYSIDPTTLIKLAIDEKNKKLYVDELYYDNKELSTDDIYNINNKNIHFTDDLIVADKAEQRLIDELHAKGLNIIECEKGPGSVAEGITSLLGYQIIVTPRSHNIKTELLRYKWNNKKAGIPIDAYNHTIDPMRYAFKELSYPKAAIF